MNFLWVIIIFLVFGVIVAFCFYSFSDRKKPSKLIKKGEMTLDSPAFRSGHLIPTKYTCKGENINPPFQISKIPAEETKSLAFIIDIPDSPIGAWSHWLVWNINPSTTLIEENSFPEGAIEGMNDSGRNSYGGSCPGDGVYHYHFKIYALDKKLALNSFSKQKDLERAMADHILDSAEMIGFHQ